ncbi:hypothetical protein BCR35DRAFT_293569 [Leucosporidium creatinivorum]|uniref:Uncharacterized protein n=1 Tax=Leucosporidium creatinivorum TaxID=106004 RepID=A0A1Y2EQP7_9BASI|nr:hypothetical protein BCR35DRAFT_293569 [Leucosporidium creatinivorum]
MAAALLASPSVHYDSPDSSFSSESSDGPISPSSPRLPALSSPFSVTQHSASPGDETSTPTRSREGSAPGWVTEELEEEWVEEQPDDDDDEQQEQQANDNSSGASNNAGGSVRRSSTIGSITAHSQHSLDRTKPRVPSSLRHVYSSPNNIPQPEDSDALEDSVVLQPSPNSSSAGTFVVRSNPSSQNGGMGGENQLQAAVRALKGPSAGLGGSNEEDGEDTDGQGGRKSPKKPSSDRLGLMSLFDPPSPPPALPPSTVTAPSSQAFTFAPPTTGPRSSWKSLPHFSPESNDSTPIARPRATAVTPIGGDTMQLAMDETPSRPARQEAPAPKVKERYLHRSVAAAPPSPEAPLTEKEIYEPPAVTQQHDETRLPSPQPDTPVPGTPSSGSHTNGAPSTPQTGTPALKLFSFQYDTFTRNHLAALVDEIDELGASPPQASGMGMLDAAREQVEEQRAWETSFVDVAPPAPRLDEEDDTEQQDGDSQDSILARGTRSTKRIRLSPRMVQEQVEERERSVEWSASNRRSARRSSGGRHGGIRSALGSSAARRQARHSPTYTSAASAARSRHSFISASRSNYSQASSHPFARSLDQSGRLATPHSARSQALSHHTPSPAPSHLAASKSSSTSTRDRLAEAHELLERIRAKTAERDRRTASSSVVPPASPSPAQSSRYPDTIELDSDDDDDGPLPSAQKARSATSRFIATNPSPRKLLRRLSASDEVDEELREGVGAVSPPEQSDEEQDQDDHRPPLPHLAAAASASLRSALEQSSAASASPATPASTVELGRQSDLAASRRHFARTPISSAPARRSRRSLEELFPNTTTSHLNGDDDGEREGRQRKVSATSAISSSIASNSTTTAANTIANSTPGQGHARHRSLTTIGPNDVEALLASASAPSRMVFDREQNRWIKTARTSVSLFGGSVAEEDGEHDQSGSTEEDPFRDFESTRASGEIRGDVSRLSSLTLKEARAEAVDAGLEGLGIMTGTPLVVVEEKEVVEEREKAVSPDGACYFEMPPPEERREEVEVVLEVEEEDTATWGEGEKARRELAAQGEEKEESPLHLFRAAMRASQSGMKDHQGDEVDGAEADDDETDLFPPSLDVTAEQGIVSRATATVVASPSSSPARLVSLPLPAVPPPNTTFASPARLTTSPSSLVPNAPATPRPPTTTSSSSNATPIPLPRSALKPSSRSKSDPIAGTPQAQQIASDLKVPRSVSFSDGKTSGKIEGLVVEREKERLEMGSRLKFEVLTKSSEGSASASGEGLMGEGFGGEPGSLIMDEAPDVGLPSAVSTRTKNIEDALEELQGAGPPSATASPSSLVISSFDSAQPVRARADRSSHSNHSTSRTFRRTTNADATFLTECSFGVSADRLLQFITDVEPFEPDWEGLRSIDLRKKGAESVVRLKEFLPNLDEVNLNDNEVAFLTGVPSTVRTLLLSSNRISSLTSFTHLRNLERIDISHNQIDSVHQLSCLRHLRELKADGNRISDLSGLGEIDGLLRLSVKGNKLERVDFAELKWARLETLNLSRNKLTVITGVEHLQSATMLNFDHNSLSRFAPTAYMPRLRVLRLCSNPIESLDIGFATKLRTLFIDGAKLGVVHGTDELRKLENLSVRDQSGAALTLAMSHIRDVKRLYLSGNPIPATFPSEKFFNLVYLELAMCQLTSLPANLASVVPNVRVLNLNFNFLEDLAPLEGLTRLSKLTVVGARLTKCRPVASVLSSMTELEELDLRMNALTLPFYPPFVSPPSALLPSHSEHHILHPDDDEAPSSSPADWPAIDSKFRKSLPDEWYSKRATYRAVILQTVPSLLRLDGLLVAKERPRLARVVTKLVKSRE